MAYECGHGFTPCHRLLGGSYHLVVYIENNLRWRIEQRINNTETSSGGVQEEESKDRHHNGRRIRDDISEQENVIPNYIS